MKITRRRGYFVFALIFLGLAGTAHAQKKAVVEPTPRVVVFNFAEVLKQSAKLKDLKAKIYEYTDPKKKEMDQIKKEVQKWAEARSDKQASNDDKIVYEKKLADAKRRLEDLGNEVRKELKIREEKYYLAFYAELLKVVKTYADANGIHMVFACVEPEESDRLKINNIMRKIQGMDMAGSVSILYSQPNADITRHVIDLVNGKSPKNPAPSPAATEAIPHVFAVNVSKVVPAGSKKEIPIEPGAQPNALSALEALFEDMSKAVRDHANGNRGHLVLAYMEPTEEEPLTAENVMRKIKGMDIGGAVSVFYVHPKADASRKIIERMNPAPVQQAAKKEVAPAKTASRHLAVNVARIFQEYQGAKDFKAENDKWLRPHKEKMEKLAKDVIDMKKDAQDPQVAPQDKEILERQIKGSIRELEALQADIKERATEKNDRQFVEVYKDLTKAIEDYAKANRGQLVFGHIEPPEKDLFSENNIRRKIYGMDTGRGASLSYLDPQADISQQIIDRMNRAYAKLKSVKSGD